LNRRDLRGSRGAVRPIPRSPPERVGWSRAYDWAPCSAAVVCRSSCGAGVRQSTQGTGRPRGQDTHIRSRAPRLARRRMANLATRRRTHTACGASRPRRGTAGPLLSGSNGRLARDRAAFDTDVTENRRRAKVRRRGNSPRRSGLGRRPSDGDRALPVRGEGARPHAMSIDQTGVLWSARSGLASIERARRSLAPIEHVAHSWPRVRRAASNALVALASHDLMKPWPTATASRL